MTRRFARELFVVRVVALFIVVLASWFAGLYPAPAASAAWLTEHASTALVQAGGPSQAPQHSRGTVDAQRVPRNPGLRKKSITVPKDSGNPLFLPAVPYDSGGVQAASVAIADVNGDGKPDLLVANNYNCYSSSCETSGSVGVLLGNGDGTFQPAVSYNTGGQYTIWVAVADVNGDGKPDLAVVSYNSGSGSVSVLLGNGDGTFQPAVTYGLTPAGATPETIAIADVNSDGKPDLVVGLFGSQVDVLLGNGDGTFQPAVTYGDGCCNKGSLAVADVNRDGKLDLLLVFAFCDGCVSMEGRVGVMLGNGDGTFQPQVLYDSGGDYPVSIAVADVNNDGKPDLVVANSCSVDSGGFCSGAGSVGVLLGNGDGTFQPVVSYSAGGLSFFSVAVADVDGDGKPDLVAAGCPTTNGSGPVYCGGSADGSLAALLGNGDGTFQPAVVFDAGGYWPISVAAADLNGDGKPDVAVASWRGDATSGYDGSVGVLLNGGGSTAKPTTTTLVSSLNPSIVGEYVSFTAAVSSESGTPSGTVIFYDSTSVLGSVTLGGGSASLSTPWLTAGSHSITAVYQGSGGFGGSASVALNQVVNALIPTTTSMTSSSDPSFKGQSVTFTATVTSPAGPPTSGTLTFRYKTRILGVAGLTGGAGSVSVDSLPVGDLTITAFFYSPPAYASSGVQMFQVVTDKVQTTTSVTSNLNPSPYGQAVTFAATITSGGGAISDGELVKFFYDGAEIGSGTTADGVAKFTTSSLPSKTDSVKATYTGDASFQPSSGTMKQVVMEQVYPTTTALSSSLNPSNYGQAVTFTAQVTTTSSSPLTGQVTFRDGTTVLGSIGSKKMIDGVATLTTPWLGGGTHSITAEYDGDRANAKSTSAAVSQVVNAASTITTISP
jgi:hypothetical protein